MNRGRMPDGSCSQGLARYRLGVMGWYRSGREFPLDGFALLAQTRRVLNRLTNLFPVWVSLGALLALIEPAWFTWFQGQAIT